MKIKDYSKTILDVELIVYYLPGIWSASYLLRFNIFRRCYKRLSDCKTVRSPVTVSTV